MVGVPVIGRTPLAYGHNRRGFPAKPVSPIGTHRLHTWLNQFPIIPLKQLFEKPAYVSLLLVIRLPLRKTERLTVVPHQPFLKSR